MGDAETSLWQKEEVGWLSGGKLEEQFYVCRGVC